MRSSDEILQALKRKAIYDRAADDLETIFRLIEAVVPKPTRKAWGKGIAYRHEDRPIEAAIFLKFARLLSLVHAMLELLSAGRVQEQCVLQRSIEETNEDIVFLCLAITENSMTPRHEKYLAEFWKEDYSDPTDPVGTRLPRAFSRRGINSFINRAFNQPDPSLADNVGRTIFEMYSGFLHGAAPHIYELYDEDAECFMTKGISSSVRHIDYIFDAQNSLYRSLLSAVFVAKAFGLAEIADEAKAAADRFETSVGRADLMKEA